MIATERRVEKKKVLKVIQVPKVVYETHMVPIQVPDVETQVQPEDVLEEIYEDKLVLGEDFREIRIPQHKVGTRIPAPAALGPARSELFDRTIDYEQTLVDSDPGDVNAWLAETARDYQCSVRRLIELNGLRWSTDLRRGCRLRIPLDRLGFADDGDELVPAPPPA
mmetsp:Transcript_80271/g.215155  ORF Transcript_80271/g.215155 Transcript_80271/m.215155 type:complete len:166 (+) Transcript_80271:153-650(+)